MSTSILRPPAEGSAPPKDDTLRAARRTALVLVVVIVLTAAAVAVLFIVHQRSLEARERDAAILVAARSEVLELLNVDARTAPAQFDRAVAGATGKWKQRLVSDGGALVQAVRDAQVDSRTTIGAAGVESSDDERAAVTLVAQMFVGNEQGPATSPRPLRVRLSLEKEADGWLVSDLEFVA